MRLVCCLVPSVILFRNPKISSEVMLSRLFSPKSWQNLEKTASYALTVFFLGIGSMIIQPEFSYLCNFHFLPSLSLVNNIVLSQ